MLFNTPEFIYLFMPAAVALHFLVARRSIEAAVVVTALVSLLFYAWWNPPFVVLPALSILVNFWLARRMVAAGEGVAKALMIAGITANVLVLCHYKYTDFLVAIVDGHKPVPPNVPLALSFTTFVQIAFLVYVYQRRIKPAFSHYALFVAFFPHLIAGPIVRWGSFGRQIGEAARYRLDWNNVALGLTVFTLGLAKKVLIADSLSPHVALVFDAASRGEPVTAAAAWGASVAFIIQIFFDFSGYSEMAVGIGLLFNFRLPVNFAAPLRATNMFDLWRRWHITLSRLARDLIYVPLSRGGAGTIRRSLNLFLTMVVIGIWHGAGWPFVVWGAYNGVLLWINQAWQSLVPGRPSRAGRAIGWVLTFSAFASGGVFFRSPDLGTAWHIITAMVGFGDAPVPAHLPLDWDDWLISRGIVSQMFVRTWFGTNWTMVGMLWTLGALAIILLLPDTMEIVDYREGDAQSNWRRPVGRLKWRPSVPALAMICALFLAAFSMIGRVSEFLYYQF